MSKAHFVLQGENFLSIYLSCTVLVGGYIKCMSLFFSSACKNELETGK